MKLQINPDIAKHFSSKPTLCFQQLMTLPGKSYRKVARRETVEVILDGRHYFIKRHYGVGLREIIKNLVYGRLPIVSAMTEVSAIQAIEKLGINTTHCVGFGVNGINPATVKSFLMTEKIDYRCNLEELANTFATDKPRFAFKRALIKEVAQIARTMHNNGINHRDFYLCHFLYSPQSSQDDLDYKLHLIDLHRAQIRSEVPLRWQLKDLAGLYFSAMDCGLSQKDCYYFIACYTGQSISALFRDGEQCDFWKQVATKAKKLYCKEAS